MKLRVALLLLVVLAAFAIPVFAQTAAGGDVRAVTTTANYQ